MPDPASARPRSTLPARLVANPLPCLVLCVGILAACHCTPRAVQQTSSNSAPQVPGISGMVQLHDTSYLVIHDSKDVKSARAGLLSVDPRQWGSYIPVPITDGALAGGPLSDLEAVAAVPGRKGEFLLLESGGEAPLRAGRRLAHAALEEGEHPRLRILACEDIAASTPSLVNCEGLVCWRQGDRYRVLIADRGLFQGASADLALGTLTISNSSLHFEPDSALPRPLKLPDVTSGDWRVCADLYVDSQGVLWGVCNQDTGDFGPFRSRIYRAGALSEGVLRVDAPLVVYELDGLKIEALGACTLGRARMSIGSDDERLGAVWRPLPPQ